MSQRNLALVTFALIAASVALGWLAHDLVVFPGDREVSAWARDLGPRFEPVAFVFNERDLWIFAGLLLSAAAILWVRGYREAFAVTLLAGLLRASLSEPKAWVDRPRPEGGFPVLDVVDTPSFPSGHTMTAAVAFGVWFLYAPLLVGPRWAPLARVASALGVALMAVSRMWAGVHWFSDTYGAVVWVAALFATVILLLRYGGRPRAAPGRVAAG